MLALETAVILVVPVVVGMRLGRLVRRRMRRRITGVAGLLACLVLPAGVAGAATVVFPVVGLWDGILEGLLCGVGLVWAAHAWYADPRNMWLTLGAVGGSLLALEAGARIFLGSAPAYPVGDGPHFLLSTLLRSTSPDSPMFQRGAMPYFLERQAMEARPPSAMLTKEIVCSIAYGSAYSGAVDVSRERAAVFPDRVALRPGASRRVLHIGDSMVFGSNVHRDRTFTVNLEKLEPDVQHINGGIAGMAPDDYLVVLNRWIARERVDLAVVYLFAGNDMVGMDAPHPCSDWQSILVYEDGHARLRFAAPKSVPRIGLRWLVANSPLPFPGRAMIVAGSRLAAFSGAALEAWTAQVARVDTQVQTEHLESILRTARDGLRAQEAAFVVVALPHADTIDVPGGPSEDLSARLVAVARRLGVPHLDASEVIRRALARGEDPIQPDGSHFNEEGHRLVATWLHEHLAVAAEAP